MECWRLTTKTSQARNSPIIVGERYELAEAAAAAYSGEVHSGLSVKPVCDAALRPMSGYEKSSTAELSGEPDAISGQGRWTESSEPTTCINNLMMVHSG